MREMTTKIWAKGCLGVPLGWGLARFGHAAYVWRAARRGPCKVWPCLLPMFGVCSYGTHPFSGHAHEPISIPHPTPAARWHYRQGCWHATPAHKRPIVF